MAIAKLDHVFIEKIPDILEEGVLYISLRFNVSIHSCCCGCKDKVVMPLSPARWRMTYNGKTVSFHPSIGNWNLPCRTHYYIINSQVEWAGDWTEEDVIAGKTHERQKRARYHKKVNEVNILPISKIEANVKADESKKKESFLDRIKRFFSLK